MTLVGTREQLGRHSEAERLWAAIQHIDKGKLAGGRLVPAEVKCVRC
jgi:hypothetical protein